MDELKVATMCSGIGSPEMALRNLDIPHEIQFFAEIDKYARETYLANFSAKMQINDMTEPDYEGEEYYSDLIVAGLPCQSFSLAGKRLGELDPRGLLFFDFYRYVKNQSPKYFIIENVKGLLSDNEGNTFQNWINLLGQSVNGDQFMFPHEDSLMYNLHWQVLNTKDYGLPQNRERVFLIGIRNDLPNDFNFPRTIPLELRLKDVLEENVDEKYYLSEKMLTMLTTHSERHTEKGTGFAVQFKNEDDVANCLRANAAICPTDNILKVPSATKSGYEIAIGAMRGRNPENPSSRKKGDNFEQTLEINENGTSNCLSTVQKDNVVVERKIIGYTRDSKGEVVKRHLKDESGTLTTSSGGGGNTDQFVVETYNHPKVEHILSGGKWDKIHEQSRRVYSENGIAPTIHTMGGGNQEIKVLGSTGGKNEANSRIYSTDGISPTIMAGNNGGGQSPVKHLTHDYRIRKLTPLEAFRLQGFPDSFIKPVSNSQLYKQAGNSISVPVIQAILKNLLKNYMP